MVAIAREIPPAQAHRHPAPTKNWSILNWISNMESVMFDCFLNFLWLWYIINLAITFNTHIVEVLALGYFIQYASRSLPSACASGNGKKEDGTVPLQVHAADVAIHRLLPALCPTLGTSAGAVFRTSYKDAWNPKDLPLCSAGRYHFY